MSYDMIDRFLRNNLGDDDYAEYSAALDSLVQPAQPKPTDPRIAALEAKEVQVVPQVEANNDEVICPNCCHQFRAIPVNVQTKCADYEAALEELACLGNGDRPGNSIGNTIAREALAKHGGAA